MANPSYSLDNITFVTLPGAYRLGGRPRSYEHSVVELESDSGKKFVYEQFTRRTRELHWRLNETQLQVFDDFHVAVSGNVFPFYFSISGAGAGDSILVRKEPNFDPTELDSPGEDGFMFDYVLHLTEEIA